MEKTCIYLKVIKLLSLILINIMMSKNYYNILDISSDANEADIARSYKRLSLKFHPKLSKLDYNTTYYHFCEISEAYEILSDRIFILKSN